MAMLRPCKVLRRALLSMVVCTLSLAGIASAQDPVYDVSGAQRGRAYNSWLPFENIDTVTGNLMLSFTDLSLPGDAGFDLTIRRTYNSRDGRWRFGIGPAPF